MSDLPPPPPPPPPPGRPGWGGSGPTPQQPPPAPPPRAPQQWDGRGLRPVGDFLSACFTAIGRSLVPMIPVLAACAAPLVLLWLVADGVLGVSDYLDEVTEADTDPETGELVLPDWDVDVGTLVAFGVAIGVAFAVVALVVTITGVVAMDRSHRGEPFRAGDLMAEFARTIGPLLGLTVSIVLLGFAAAAALVLVTVVEPVIGVLLLLALLPVGAYVGVRLSLTLVIAVLERRGVSALGRSWHLTRGHFWGLLGRLLLFSLVLGLASQLIGVPLQFASLLGSVVLAITTVVLAILQVAYQAFGQAGAVVLYRDLLGHTGPPRPDGPWQQPAGPPPPG